MPPKQYDFSAFDKPITEIEKESPKYDFSAFDEEKPITLLEQPKEDGLIPIGEKDIQNFEQLKAPMMGYVAGKAAQKGIEKTGELVSKLPEKLATTIGGLTPEQVKYVQQNYKNIESGKGISEEAVREVYSKLENVFKQKNIQANRARELAEQSLEVPLTKELMEKAASQALPKVMDKIEPEKEAFQKALKERTQTRVESEIDRLTNLLEQKKQAVIDASDYAQSRAEKAAKIAVEEATPKKEIGLVKQSTPDLKSIANKAFEEELAKSLPEQNKIQAKALKDFKEYSNQIADLQNEYYQASNVIPEIEKELIREKQTSLARKYPSVEGYEDVKNLGSDIEKLTKPYSEITQLEKSRAAEELRNIRKKAFGDTPEVKDEASKVFAEELRQLMAPEGSTSDVEYKRVSNLLNQLKQAQTEGFITRKTGEVIPGNIDLGEEDLLISKFKPESVEIGQKEQQFISKVVNPSKHDLQNIDIIRGREVLQNLVDDPKLIDEVRQAAIKQGLLDPKSAFKFGPIDAFRVITAGGAAAAGLGAFPTFLAGAYEGVKYARTPQGAYKLATLAPRIAETTAGKIASKVGKGALKKLPYIGAGIGGIAAQAAEEAIDTETSGATPSMPEYWLERGVRDPEEQRQRAALASFKEGLPFSGRVDEIPSAYEKPETKQYKEQVLAVKKSGGLAPTYVEAPLKKVLKSDDPAEIASIAQAMQNSPDKASQEYARVLSQINQAQPSQKEAILFGLNQQPAFRELVRKLKKEE